MSTPSWRATVLAVQYASGKDLLNIFNGALSASIVRCYRFFAFNNGTQTSAGTLSQMQIRRLTGVQGGVVVPPLKMDISIPSLDINTTMATNSTVVSSDVFRQRLTSTPQPSANGASINEWELQVPFAQIMEAGYLDPNVQPITCRAGQGVEIANTGTAVSGYADCEIEFSSLST